LPYPREWITTDYELEQEAKGMIGRTKDMVVAGTKAAFILGLVSLPMMVNLYLQSS